MTDKSLQNLFNAALERPEAAERARFLDEACGSDAALRERVEKLLRAQEEVGAFMAQPSRKPAGLDFNQTRGVDIPLTEKPGDRIGRYKLLQQIGEGGCGVVYMAEQEEPVRRRVALKVIKLGMDTKQVIARFEAERQALALMDHPNIAKIFDADATETGRPYFVMELVRGVKITEFCDENKPSTADRLKLFTQVCQAVQHAHQKGVIHRDIKPANVLVGIDDGVPVPKVIDFGIAKATAGRLTDHTLFTAFEQFIGTPAYMSPEQAELTNLEVDTRSDIYSLGVLLYELLTGQPPFTQKELHAAGFDEMRRTIREREPARPSTRLTAMGSSELTTVASRRQVQPPQLIQLVRGDLDWIVMKCLQKDRARRYETVNGLGMDLTRHLNLLPVLARPDTRAYRLAKFVRRNRASVTFATVVLVALAAGLIGTITQAHRATRHARVAEEQLDFALRQLSRAEAINGLNAFLLMDVGPSGKPFTVRELLARAERVVTRETLVQDENHIELLISIGTLYEELGESAKAYELLSQAYALSRQVSDPSIRATAARSLSCVVAETGDCERGEMLIQEALRELGDAPQFALYRARTLQRGARVARVCGREHVGLERAEEAWRILNASGRMSPTSKWMATMSLAESYRAVSRNREAIAAFASAFEQLTALGRDETEQAGTLLNNWAVALDVSGRQFEAERLYRRSVAISVADDTNAPVSPMLLNNLARCLNDLHRFHEAAAYAEQAYERASAASNEQVINMCLNVRASIFRNLGELERAAEMVASFEAKTQQLLPPGHVAHAVVVSQKSLLALARGDLPAAQAEADRSVTMVETNSAARSLLALLRLRRAEIHLKAKQFESARADAERSLVLNLESAEKGDISSWIGLAHLTMARALEAQGKTGEARAAFAAALEQLRPSLGEDHPETRAAATRLQPVLPAPVVK